MRPRWAFLPALVLGVTLVAAQEDGLDTPSLGDATTKRSPALSLESVTHDGFFVRKQGSMWRLKSVSPWRLAASVQSKFVKVGAPSYLNGIGHTDDAVFVRKCAEFDSLTGTDWTMRIRMGANVDYFKPVSTTVRFCDMVTSNDLFLWSSEFNGTYVKPSPASDKGGPRGIGGSNSGWLKLKSDDKRDTLPFWGIDAKGNWLNFPETNSSKERQDRILESGAGCCNSLENGRDKDDWGQLFTMDVYSPNARMEASLQELHLTERQDVVAFATMVNSDKVMRWKNGVLGLDYLKQDDAFAEDASLVEKQAEGLNSPVGTVRYESVAMPGWYLSAGRKLTGSGSEDESFELTLVDSKSPKFQVANTLFKKVAPLFGLCEHANPCDPHAHCVDGVLSYRCTCNGGYYGSGMRCQACLLQRTSCPAGSVLDLRQCKCSKVQPALSGVVYGRSFWQKVQAVQTPDARWRHTMVAHSARGKPALAVFGGLYVASSGSVSVPGSSFLQTEQTVKKKKFFGSLKRVFKKAVRKGRQLIKKVKPVIKMGINLFKKHKKKAIGGLAIGAIAMFGMNRAKKSGGNQPSPAIQQIPSQPIRQPIPPAPSAPPPRYLGGGHRHTTTIINNHAPRDNSNHAMHNMMFNQQQMQMQQQQHQQAMALQQQKSAHELELLKMKREDDRLAAARKAEADKAAKVAAAAAEAERKLVEAKLKLEQEKARAKRQREAEEKAALEAARKAKEEAEKKAEAERKAKEEAARKLAAAEREAALRQAKKERELAQAKADQEERNRQEEAARRKADQEEADRLRLDREAAAFASLPEFENKREAAAEPGVAADAMGAVKAAASAVRMGQAMQYPAPPPANRLPKGWEVAFNPKDGRPYYIDHNERTTSWDPPDLIPETNSTDDGDTDEAAGNENNALSALQKHLPKKLKASQRELDTAKIFDDIWEFALPSEDESSGQTSLSGSWESIDDEGSSVPRYGHCSVVMDDRWMVSFGGNTLRLFQTNSDEIQTALDSCKGAECDELLDTNTELVGSGDATVVFDLKERKWTEGLVSMAQPMSRDGHSCVLHASQNEMIVYGGQGAAKTVTNPDGSKNKVAGPVLEDMWRVVVTVADGDDRPQAVWKPLNPGGSFRPPALRDHQAAFYNGKMYVFGGRGGAGADSIYPKDLYVYDRTTNTWDGKLRSAGGAIPAGLSVAGACATMVGSRIFAYSGVVSSLSVAQRRWNTLYSKDTGNAEMRRRLTTRRYQTCVADPQGSAVYMFGGTSVTRGASSSSPFDDMYRLEMSAKRVLMEEAVTANAFLTHHVADPADADLSVFLEPFDKPSDVPMSPLDPKVTLGSRTELSLQVEMPKEESSALVSLKILTDGTGERGGGIFLGERDLLECIEGNEGWLPGATVSLKCSIKDSFIHLPDLVEWDKLNLVKIQRSRSGAAITVRQVTLSKDNSFSTLDDVVYPEVQAALASPPSPGLAGSSVSFNGFSQSASIRNGRALFDNSLQGEEYTFEAWIKPQRMEWRTDSPSENGGGCILSKYDSDHEDMSRNMAALIINGQGGVQWMDRQNLQASRDELKSSPLAVESWHHVAVTFARPGAGDVHADGAMKLYVNGSVVASNHLPVRSPDSSKPVFSELALLGACNNDGQVTRRYRGQMDDVRVWQVERSQEQIRSFLERPLISAEDMVGLVASWDMNHGSSKDGGEPNTAGLRSKNDQYMLDMTGPLSQRPSYIKSGVPLNSICLNECFGRGTCGDDLKCDCDDGYSGEFCQTTGCPAGCSGHGRCADGNCICTAGYWGLDCAKSSCTAGCNKRGSCVFDWPNGFTCDCQEGFTGPQCENAQCPEGCSGHGACFEGKCTCEENYAGEACEINVEPGCPFDCAGNGDCKKGACVCSEGWKGASCTVWSGRGSPPTADCAARGSSGCFNLTCECPDCCAGHGGCRKGVCNCDPGFYGRSCSRQTCGNFPGYTGPPTDKCSGRGSCIEGQCLCKPGYTGDECGERTCDAQGTNLNSCTKPNGICHDGKCECNKGWTGDDCSEELPSIDGCGGQSTDINNHTKDCGCTPQCLEHGHCIKGKCFCQDGYKGLDCTIPLCVDGCSGHGKCTKYGCQCTGGYGGDDCGQDVLMPFQAEVVCDSPSTACVVIANEPTYEFERSHGLPVPSKGEMFLSKMPSGFYKTPDNN